MRRMFLIVVGLAVLAGFLGAAALAAQPKFGRVSVALKTPGAGNRICGKVVYRIDDKPAGFNLICNTKAKEQIRFKWGRALVVRLQGMPKGCSPPAPHATRVTELTRVTFRVGCLRLLPKPLVSVTAQLNCVNGGFGKIRLQATVGGRTSSFESQCGASIRVALVLANTRVQVCLVGVPADVRLTSAQCVDVVAGVTPAPTFGLERGAATTSTPPPSPGPSPAPPPSPPPTPPASVKLTASVTGSGRVSGPGIDCPGGDCVEVYPQNQVGALITLTASTSDSEFAGWDGACASAGKSRSCVLTMDQDRSVSATFRSPPRLTVAVSGSGSVTSSPSGVSCPGDCAETYPTGTSVTLTATPATGWNFSGWSGACSGSSSSCVITLDEGKNTAATFTQPSPTSAPTQFFTLSVGVSGGGTVTGPGISCPGDCSEVLADGGTTVALAASPSSGWTFSGWSGDCAGSSSCSVAMDRNRAVTATFTQVSSPPPGGGGPVDGNP